MMSMYYWNVPMYYQQATDYCPFSNVLPYETPSMSYAYQTQTTNCPSQTIAAYSCYDPEPKKKRRLSQQTHKKPNLERARSDMNQIYQQLKTAPAAPKEKPRSSTYIGVVRTNPSDYANQFSDELVKSEDLPDFVKNIPTPEGIVLAADYKPRAVLELEGSLEGLAMIDLEKEGLAEYKSQLDEYLDALNKNKKKEEAKTAESGENVEVLSKASPSS